MSNGFGRYSSAHAVSIAFLRLMLQALIKIILAVGWALSKLVTKFNAIGFSEQDIYQN